MTANGLGRSWIAAAGANVSGGRSRSEARSVRPFTWAKNSSSPVCSQSQVRVTGKLRIKKLSPLKRSRLSHRTSSCLNVVRIGSGFWFLPTVEIHDGLITALARAGRLKIADLRNARPVVIHDPDKPVAGLRATRVDDMAVEAC